MILAAGAWENRETRETIVATENFMFFDFLASDICRLKGFSVWRKPSNLARLYTIPFSWKYHGRFSLSRWFECWLISLYTSFCDAVHAHSSGPQDNENDPGWEGVHILWPTADIRMEDCHTNHWQPTYTPPSEVRVWTGSVSKPTLSRSFCYISYDPLYIIIKSLVYCVT